MPPIIYILIILMLIGIFTAAYFQIKRNRFLSVEHLEELKKKDDFASKEEIEGLCPVCGFPFLKQLKVKPWDNELPSDEICPGCGTQFGYDDNVDGGKDQREEVYIILRQKFLHKGKAYENLMKKQRAKMEKARKS